MCLGWLGGLPSHISYRFASVCPLAWNAVSSLFPLYQRLTSFPPGPSLGFPGHGIGLRGSQDFPPPSCAPRLGTGRNPDWWLSFWRDSPKKRCLNFHALQNAFYVIPGAPAKRGQSAIQETLPVCTCPHERTSLHRTTSPQPFVEPFLILLFWDGFLLKPNQPKKKKTDAFFPWDFH